MFKNRLFLSGLGVGLILGAILLQIMNSMNNAGSRKELIYTQSQFDAALEKQLKEAKLKMNQTITPSATPTDLKSGSASPTPSPIPSATPKLSELPKPTNSSPESPKPPEIKKSITIIEGMTSIEVTNLFFNNGIISDKEAFLAEIMKHQLERKMQIGSYSFDSSAKIVDMVKTISTPLK